MISEVTSFTFAIFYSLEVRHQGVNPPHSREEDFYIRAWIQEAEIIGGDLEAVYHMFLLLKL